MICTAIRPTDRRHQANAVRQVFTRRRRQRTHSPLAASAPPGPPHGGRHAPPPARGARMAQFPTVRWSADFGPKRRPIVRRSRRKPHEIHRVGNGGQGRTDSRSESGQRSCPKGEDRPRPIQVNRTIETRIFSTTESLARREQAEDREGVSPWPTEPPPPDRAHTEPGRRNSDRTRWRPIRINGLRASRPNLFRTAVLRGPELLAHVREAAPEV